MKQDIHRWLRTGIAALGPASTFMDDLEDYVRKTGDPSLVAMTKEQAIEILAFLEFQHRISGDLQLIHALRERIRICVLQGEYSLAQKRAKQMRG